MDSRSQPPGNFEAQLRTMILNNNSTQAPQSRSNYNHQSTRPPSLHPSQYSSQQGRSGYHSVAPPSHLHNNPRGMPQPQHIQHVYNNHGHHQGRGQHSGPVPPHQRSRFQQQLSLDPNTFQRQPPQHQPRFQRGGFGHHNSGQMHQHPGHQQLYNPNTQHSSPMNSPAEQHMRQSRYLEQLATTEVRNVEMTSSECEEKEAFRHLLDRICKDLCSSNPDNLPSVSLECFGSFKSGFATAGSDMDLAIVVKDSDSSSQCFSLHEDSLPRVLEKHLLELRYGARLLTRTRVPIIKICEKPGDELLEKLREERAKWDVLPDEQKYPHLYLVVAEAKGDADDAYEETTTDGAEHKSLDEVDETGLGTKHETLKDGNQATELSVSLDALKISETEDDGVQQITSHPPVKDAASHPASTKGSNSRPSNDNSKPWTRERRAGPLDFPKTGAGIQSDINFFNPLGLHNTQLLRCYSTCDTRVRPLILFIKAWVKRRKINSSYSGTLSSYGYVLMVLHYLINVSQPPVLPNLQDDAVCKDIMSRGSLWSDLTGDTVDGWFVKFWRDEEAIATAAQLGLLTANTESIGSLLAGFFHYYSSQGGGQQFIWMQDVLSLRTTGGILTKADKGWTKAVTETSEDKVIQHRYLFCIEDPFELSHNVARTVTHKGIVAIRDEFRRARRILLAASYGQSPRDGELFAELVEAEEGIQAQQQRKHDGVANDEHPQQTPGAAHAPPQPQPQLPAKPKVQLPSLPPKPSINRTAQPLNVKDAEDFPTLGAAKPVNRIPNRNNAPRNDPKKRFRRQRQDRKAEADAEHGARDTATGAAMAVIGD